ncbi:hypothetical protein LTR49_028661, partial [Elasticomyces elasticus]
VRDVADQLKLYGRKDPKANLLQLLRNWLRDEGKGRWLVVLDNADDAVLLLEPSAMSGEAESAQRRIEYIPMCDHGSVMITTRSRGEALRLVYDSETIEVLPMSKNEAEALLNSKLEQCRGDHRTLALALDCMPLAITLAAAYIRERTPRCSVREYHKEMERSRASRTSLLRRNISLPSRDAEANNSVLVTWQISFEHIYITRRSAAELLSLMSVCDRLAIPESLLRINNADGDEDCNQAADFEEDMMALRSFSFISQTADAQTWEMHRLVQDATQVWLGAQGRLDDARDRPNARVGDSDVPLSLVCTRAGELVNALAMAKLAMETRVRVLGGEHPDTLTSIANLASTYRNQGQWEELEELEVKMMETSRRVLGGEHPDTLTSMANLASTYRDQGRWEEAEELFVKVMETSVRVLSDEHRDTLARMASLAPTCREQGRWKEAKELMSEAAEASRKVLGNTHPDTLARTSAFEQIDRRDSLRTVDDGTSTAALAGDAFGGRANLALRDASSTTWLRKTRK